MKWLAFIMTLLAFCAFSRALQAKEPRTLSLAESDVTPIRTALGYTTMLNFDSRPSSVILGDQDAFKIEYVGNGLAIKPLVPHGKTNLFVFTDYDRFSFRLLAGPPTEADYAIRIKAKRANSYSVEASDQRQVASTASPLIERKIGRRTACGGFQLEVESITWPKSGSTYLVRFQVLATRGDVPDHGLRFEPGDYDISQSGKSLPIENLYLERLVFMKQAKAIRGTLVLRQVEVRSRQPLVLSFAPDFLKKKNRCLSVTFSRGITTPQKLSAGASAPKKS